MAALGARSPRPGRGSEAIPARNQPIIGRLLPRLRNNTEKEKRAPRAKTRVYRFSVLRRGTLVRREYLPTNSVYASYSPNSCPSAPQINFSGLSRWAYYASASCGKAAGNLLHQLGI